MVTTNLKMKTPIPQPDRAMPQATALSLVKYCVTINTAGINTVPNPHPETCNNMYQSSIP